MMTAKELKIVHQNAMKIAEEYRAKVNAQCKAEGRMKIEYDPWSGREVSVPAWTAEENAQNIENNIMTSKTFAQWEAAQKAERKAKREAKKAAK